MSPEKLRRVEIYLKDEEAFEIRMRAQKEGLEPDQLMASVLKKYLNGDLIAKIDIQKFMEESATEKIKDETNVEKPEGDLSETPPRDIY